MSTSDPNKLVISEEELASPEVDERVEALKAAATPQMVRQVGTAPTGGSRVSSNVGSLALAGLIGGALGWLISEVVSSPDASDQIFGDNLAAGTAFWVALYALGLSGVLSSWEGIQARSGAKAASAMSRAVPAALVGAAVSGWIAQVAIYEPMLESAYQSATSDADMMAAFHLARGLAFMFVGVVVGAALGISSGSGKRAVNGAIGGAVGGFVGGFVFDYVGAATDSGGLSRAVALGLTGTLIGLAIGLVENARKEHWLEIVSGGMAGKQFILYNDRTVIGSSPACSVTLIKDPQIAPEHVTLVSSAQGLRMSAMDPSRPTLVNGQPQQQAVLTDGDLVQVGSSVVRYRQKAQATPTLVASG